MNLLSFEVVFRCKRWQSPVGASVIRDGAPAIDLVDGEPCACC